MRSVVARLVEWPEALHARVDGTTIVALAPIDCPSPVRTHGRKPKALMVLGESQLGTGSPDRDRNDAIQTARRHLARAWHGLLHQRLADAPRHITAAEWEIADLPTSDIMGLRRETTVLRAAGFALRDEASAARAALDRHPEAVDAMGSLARTIYRFVVWRQGDWETLRGLAPVLAHDGALRRTLPITVMNLAIDAAICLEQLRIPLAKRLALDALQIAERCPGGALAAADLAASVAAQVAYEEGRLDEAERLLTARLPTIRVHGFVETAIRAFDVLARLAASRGRDDLALLLLDDAEALGVRRSWPRLVAAAHYRRIEILLSADRTEEAERAHAQLRTLADGAGDYSSNDAIGQHIAVSAVRLAGAAMPSSRIVASFRRLHGQAVERGDLFAAAHLTVGLAESIALAGDEQASAEVLLTALHKGSDAGLYSMFVDAAPAIRRLIEALRDSGPKADPEGRLTPYLNSLLSCPTREEQRRKPCGHGDRPGIVSVREATILRLIANGLPNKSIALKLGIAPETVKSHAKNIFAKLAVRTRTEAVHRAQRLGVI